MFQQAINKIIYQILDYPWPMNKVIFRREKSKKKDKLLWNINVYYKF